MTIKVLLKFAENGINLTPEVYNNIINSEDPISLASSVILKIKSKFSGKMFILTEDIFKSILRMEDIENTKNSQPLDLTNSVDKNDNYSKTNNNEDDENRKNQINNEDSKDSNTSTSAISTGIIENTSTISKEDNKIIPRINETPKSRKKPKSRVAKGLDIFKTKEINENKALEEKPAINEDVSTSNETTEKKEDNDDNDINKAYKFPTIKVEDTQENRSKIRNNIKNSKRNSDISNVNFDYKVIQDTSKQSYTNGEIGNLISYFKNRYEKLRDILSKRPELRTYQNIVDIGQGNTTDFTIIGMIRDIKITKNNHKIIEIEDETSNLTVLIHNENNDLMKSTEKLVKDEVIGIIGDKKGELGIASRIIQPSVHRIAEKPMDFSIAFLSDVHIGSMTFLEDAFLKFIDWINGDFGTDEQRKIAKDVKYLIIAGDIVDGIGVYPNQDKELNIKDITEQYDKAAEYLSEIRSDVKIIIGPGNHDASRVAEPQPAVPPKYANSLYELNNVEFISNPGIVSLEGINVLIYHGRGFDDMVMGVKGMTHQRNDLVLEELLKKRHLAPIYGERTPLASELEDHLVIDEIPDIIHTGHVHINTYKKYNGIHMINSGTFQTQTEFQKIYNIVPTCAEVPVLYKGTYKQLKFV
ncbi:DNA-directed DNA polymerase II small subunit [Methanobrevibacter filiformis]|uniref:DNA polymerase II small subunit n=1 Tax=Methanobrevibacter filiformis TaxID=55758 RepID=A0A166FER9_9EURY|nr:DNA-directed DNA polymerase II small subunit [Methanobrevibacter filiformis]KZX17602.1 DNA polymerase II small subunit [Methanobrevibacter filiformis]